MTAPALTDRLAWQVELDESVATLAWSPTVDLLAVATLDGGVHLLDGAQGTDVGGPARHGADALALAWSPDGSWLATGGADGRVHVTGRSGPAGGGSAEVGGWVQALRWSRDGRHLAAAAGRSLVLLDRDARLVRRWDDQPSTVTDVAWSRDGSRVAAAAYGGLRWHQVTDPRPDPVRTFAWRGSLLVVEVSPDGRWVASGNQDSSVHVWRLWSGEDAEMTGYPQKVDTLAFSADGRTMACGGTTDISLWDFTGRTGPIGRAPAMLEGHDDQISALAFQPAGPLLASGDREGALAVWRPARARTATAPPAACYRHQLAGRVTGLSWSADGALLAAGSTDGTVTVLRAADLA